MSLAPHSRMTDFKPAILAALDTHRKKELAEKATFKARAYAKVIDELKASTAPIRTMDDLNGIAGVGAKIKEKIEEILATGALASADRVRASVEVTDTLLGVYGIGAVKAAALIAAGITTIPQLRAAVAADPALLNDKQKIGLKYYEDIQERIPRAEVAEVETILTDALGASMKATIVGSYRRGAADSGDIDCLLTHPSASAPIRAKFFREYVDRLRTSGFMIEILSQGDQKCLSIVRLTGVANAKARRLDLLMVPKDQIAAATLYFTGSGPFNIAFRKHCLTLGYTLNEHALTKTGTVPDAPEPPAFKSEREIFDFVGLVYKEPVERTGAAAAVPV